MTQGRSVSIPVGDWTLTALLDGHFDQDTSNLRGVDDDTLSKLLAEAGIPRYRFAVSVQCFVLRTDRSTILFDAGTSTRLYPTLGLMPESLAHAGIDSAAIEAVILTHLHPDHVNGITTADGARRFENARIKVPVREWRYWCECDDRAASDDVRYCRGEARFALAPYENAIDLIDDGDTPAPGVTALTTAGHTSGHMSFVIERANVSVLIIGDTAHFAPLQIAYPCLALAHDHDVAQLVDSRARLFARAARPATLVAGAHFPFPGFGRIDSKPGGGFGFKAWPG